MAKNPKNHDDLHDHDKTFRVTETTVLTTCPSVQPLGHQCKHLPISPNDVYEH